MNNEVFNRNHVERNSIDSFVPMSYFCVGVKGMAITILY
jgi:hypothetical protein